ncbi:Protein MAIN-LIKE 2 [Linum perenne]
MEDVEVLNGLPTRGRPDRRTAAEICEEWLGIAPLGHAVSRATVKVSGVKGLFDHLPTGATHVIVTIYARVFTWVLVGVVLLANRIEDHIPVYLLPLIGDPAVAASFSWGSAVIAWLYRVVGRVVFLTGCSQKGTGELGGFTLFV